MINYAAIASAVRAEMAHRGDTDKGLAKEWGVSPMTVTNIKNAKPLSAEMLCKVSIYVGANPLSFWQYQESGTYGGRMPENDATYGTMQSPTEGDE